MNRIVYQASDGAIYTVNPDGTDRRTVSGQEESQAHAVNVWPAWSPDSGTITFSAMSLVEGRANEASLRRGNALGGNEPILLHVDALTSNGINPGTPHYVLWAPNGERLALITDAGQGIVTFSMDAHTGRDVRGNYEGAPAYVSWSADATHMLVHVNDSLFMWSQDPETGRSMSQRIGSGSVSYRAPQWHPKNNTYLYVDVVKNERRLLIGELGVSQPRLVRVLDDAVEFTWSPDGTRIALLTGRGEFYELLEIIDASGEVAGPQLEGLVRAVWWSPDGQRLLTVSADDPNQDDLAVSVLDLSAGTNREVARLRGSEQFYLMLAFHSQYAASHQLWSPDSQNLVVVGAILGEEGDAGRQLTDSGAELSRVWVIDVNGILPPRPVGNGLFAAWSPT